MPMQIDIATVPHNQQRYNTVGDWWWYDPWSMAVRVSQLGDPQYEFLVALHELVEGWACAATGVTTEAVDAFDAAWMDAHPDGLDEMGKPDEPGDDPDAPYYREHQLASGIERAAATALKVDWTHYQRVQDATAATWVPKPKPIREETAMENDPNPKTPGDVPEEPRVPVQETTEIDKQLDDDPTPTLP